MKKSILLLLVAAFIVTLFTVSCSKKNDDVKEFSLRESLRLMSNTANFCGTLENTDNLSELYLMLKKDSDSDFEQHDISYGNNQFSLTINGLNTQESYKYYYVYVDNGSTKSTSKKSFTLNYSSLIVGRWSDNAESPYFEQYSANGEGKYWGGIDDIPEEDALTYDWYFDENNKLTQIHHFQGGQADLPQYCNILLLNDTRLNYNNEGWRQEYNLYRVN